MLVTLQFTISAFFVLLFIGAITYDYSKKQEEYNQGQRSYINAPEIDGYVFAGMMGSLFICMMMVPLVYAFYTHTMRSLIITGLVLLGLGLLYGTITVARKAGRQSVIRKETLRKENKRLKKIISEELDPIDHSVASMEVAAVAQKTLEVVEKARAQQYMEGQS